MGWIATAQIRSYGMSKEEATMVILAAQRDRGNEVD